MATATTTAENHRLADGASQPGAASYLGRQKYQQSRNSENSLRESLPSSILGVPLCDSPELLPRLPPSPNGVSRGPRKMSGPETQQKFYATDGPPDLRLEDRHPVESGDAGKQDHRAEDYPNHSLAASAAVPEISIAPPTTISSQDSRRSRATTTTTTVSTTTESSSSEIDSVPKIITTSSSSSSLPYSVVQKEALVETETLLRRFPIAPAISHTVNTNRPPNATESIFGEGVGMQQQAGSTTVGTIASGLSSGTRSLPKITIGQQAHPLDFPDRRSRDMPARKRPPTPYPPSEADPDHDTSTSNPPASPLLTPIVKTASIPDLNSDSEDAVWATRIQEVDPDQDATMSKMDGPTRPVQHLLRRPAQYPTHSSAKLSRDLKALAATVAATAAVEDIMDVDEAYEAEHHHQYPVISAYQSSHDLFKLPPPITAPVATIKPERVSDDAMDVDEAFEEEHHHQYPVISAYQSSHDLFNFSSSTLAAAGYVTKGTTMQASGLTKGGQMIPQGEEDDDNEKIPSPEPEDQDDKASTLSLVRGKVLSEGEVSLGLSLQAATLDAREGEQDERKARGESVARWAEEQGRIHERRRQKQKINQARTQALQDLRQDQNHRRPSRTAGKDGLPSGVPLKVRLEQDHIDGSDNINGEEEDAVLNEDGRGDGDEVLLLERVETLGAGVGRP